MSTSATDPAAVPDAWRLEAHVRVVDDSKDALHVRRYGDRMEFWTSRQGYQFQPAVVLPNDCDSETLDALEQVVEQMQAFLQTARAR